MSDVEAMAAAALSGMEMGSGPRSEGYGDADDDQHEVKESGKFSEKSSVRIL